MTHEHHTNQNGVWWRLLKPRTLFTIYNSLFIGAMLALHLNDTFDILLFLALVIVISVIHTVIHIFHILTQTKHKRSEQNDINSNTLLITVIFLSTIAILLIIYLGLNINWWLTLIFLIGLLLGYVYHYGPFPITNTVLAELYGGLLLGTAMIIMSYYVQTSTLLIEVFFISVPIAMIISCHILSKHIEQIYEDHQSGYTTLVILLGRTYAVYFLASLFIAVYGFTALFIAFNLLPVLSFIAFASIFKATRAIGSLLTQTDPSDINMAIVTTRQAVTTYYVLIGLSLLLSIWF